MPLFDKHAAVSQLMDSQLAIRAGLNAPMFYCHAYGMHVSEERTPYASEVHQRQKQTQRRRAATPQSRPDKS